MRNVIAFLVALGLVAAIFWFTRSKDEPARPAPVVTSASGTASSPSRPSRDDTVDTTTVRRLDKETRKRLGEQIAAARERARAQATAAGEPYVDTSLALEDVGAPLQDKLREALPILAECFATPGTVEALAMMTLTSDPELGTVIDTEAIKNANGDPLEPAQDTCLRDAIDALALPPLGPTAGKLPLQYTFRFD